MSTNYKFKIKSRRILADTYTPIGIYLRLRDSFPNTIMLESTDYHAGEGGYSFICCQPVAGIMVENNNLYKQLNGHTEQKELKQLELASEFDEFLKRFEIENNPEESRFSGFYGYMNFEAIQYFDTNTFNNPEPEASKIPQLRYHFYRYVIAINHFKNEMLVVEHLRDNEKSELDRIIDLLRNKSVAVYPFTPDEKEQSNYTDDEFLKIVENGIESCYKGDVIQIVLSRQFSRKFTGDEFNLYRALRSINPSPYLFYFDYGNYRIFGSSPESQLAVKEDKAYINPIAGTYKRTGSDATDRKLAKKLSKDPKENAEHVMLVDLARNDLSKHAKEVIVEKDREVQFFSHVIHLVSKVSGKLKPETNRIALLGQTFPAGTLSGAPKYRAIELINEYENQQRGFYGGALGFVGLNGAINHAIMIRSFLSKNSHLFYQAGAGIVSESQPENELQEVNNKLMALQKAIELSKTL